MKFADIKVENMISDNSGREVANQFKIFTFDGVYFQSYNTVIAHVKDGHVSIVKGGLDYSTTTNKWLYKFLSEESRYSNLNKHKMEKLIASGEIEEVE